MLLSSTLQAENSFIIYATVMRCKQTATARAVILSLLNTEREFGYETGMQSLLSG